MSDLRNTTTSLLNRSSTAKHLRQLRQPTSSSWEFSAKYPARQGVSATLQAGVSQRASFSRGTLLRSSSRSRRSLYYIFPTFAVISNVRQSELPVPRKNCSGAHSPPRWHPRGLSTSAENQDSTTSLLPQSSDVALRLHIRSGKVNRGTAKERRCSIASSNKLGAAKPLYYSHHWQNVCNGTNCFESHRTHSTQCVALYRQVRLLSRALDYTICVNMAIRIAYDSVPGHYVTPADSIGRSNQTTSTASTQYITSSGRLTEQ